MTCFDGVGRLSAVSDFTVLYFLFPFKGPLSTPNKSRRMFKIATDLTDPLGERLSAKFNF